MKIGMKMAASAVALIIATGSASADKLDDIMAAGKIVVGVKQDYRPWGYLDENGDLRGLEIDLANNVG